MPGTDLGSRQVKGQGMVVAGKGRRPRLRCSVHLKASRSSKEVSFAG